MDRIWKSGLMAGAVGDIFILLCLVVLGELFTIFKGQDTLFSLLVIITCMAAFAIAGLSSGMFVMPFARAEMESFKSGFISGAGVALLIIVFIAGMIVLDPGFIAVAPLAGTGLFVLSFIVMAIILFALAALSGMVSMVYTSYRRLKEQGHEAPAAPGDEEGLDDLRSLYDDLWKDARTLAVDMNRSIQMYLLAGLLMLVFGIIILSYAAVSLQRIYTGSAGATDYAAAIGETIGGVLMVIVGPVLIRWYYRLKSRYARLSSIEKGDVR
jgi:hypothetical protein